MTNIESARVMCRSALARLASTAADPERLRSEKLDAFHALSGAARFARLIEANEAAELLDKVADAMLDNAAMREPETAKPHLEALLREVDA